MDIYPFIAYSIHTSGRRSYLCREIPLSSIYRVCNFDEHNDRKDLSNKGKKHASSFMWETTAKKIPAVVYGPGVKNQNISVNYRDFEQALKEAGESTLIDLNTPTASII